MTRWSALLTLGAVILAAPVSTSTAVRPDMPAAASVRAVSKHNVDLLWKPDQQDIHSGAIVFDTFDSFAPPFGHERPVETQTPRKQIGSDQRSGKWWVYLTKGKNPGSCSGTFQVERNVIETTPTSQTVQYGGSLRLTGCKGVKKFSNVQPGRLGRLQGETLCTANHCRGGLEIVGTLRY